MLIELNAEEVDIVRRLVETRLKELGPEIHHTRSLLSGYKSNSVNWLRNGSISSARRTSEKS